MPENTSASWSPSPQDRYVHQLENEIIKLKAEIDRLRTALYAASRGGDAGVASVTNRHTRNALKIVGVAHTPLGLVIEVE